MVFAHQASFAVLESSLSTNKDEKHEKFLLADTRGEGIHGCVQEKQKSIRRMLKKSGVFR